jgi:hypothetical protein
MVILKEKIKVADLFPMTEKMFGNLVKAVADIDKDLLALDAEMHADLESVLLENGSEQGSLWGVNLYPEMTGEDFVEFDSMINVRPGQGNRSRGVEDPAVRAKIIELVDRWVTR